MITNIILEGPTDEFSSLLTFLKGSELKTVKGSGLTLTRCERTPGTYYREPYPVTLTMGNGIYKTYVMFELSSDDQKKLIDTLQSKLEENGRSA